jgi:hypothetical protein
VAKCLCCDANVKVKDDDDDDSERACRVWRARRFVDASRGGPSVYASARSGGVAAVCRGQRLVNDVVGGGEKGLAGRSNTELGRLLQAQVQVQVQVRVQVLAQLEWGWGWATVDK